MKRKTKNLVCICKKCGTKPLPKKESENFNSYPVICPKCGGEITFKLESEE